jgi:hypothetical protein
LLTTPSIPGGVNLEHFPTLKDYRLVELDSGWVLLNRAEDGRIETFEGLTFHGGDGSTVEMRVFGRERLIRDLKTAGFETVEVTSEPIEEMGIMIQGHCSFPMVARKAGGRDRRFWVGELAVRARRFDVLGAGARREANELAQSIQEGHEHIRRLDIELSERGKWGQRLDEDNRAKSALIQSLQSELAQTAAWGKKLEVEAAGQTAWAVRLDKEVKELTDRLERIETSRWWRLGRKLGLIT